MPDSPKSPSFSLLTLATMLSFLVIKDGQEDKARRINDKLTNSSPVHIYEYGSIGFVNQAQQEIRAGDLITIFNNQEVPADMIIISTDGGSAFFDTVSLDGETILTERYATN